MRKSIVGKPGIIIGPLDGYPHYKQAWPPPHQPLQDSTGPEAHPGRKLRCRQAPGSPEERQRVGPQANLIHARTHVWASCLHPRNTAVPDRDACGRRSIQRSEGAITGARGPGLGVGKSGGRGAGTPAAGPASKCLPASRAAAPAAGRPLLPETRGAPRPCPDPDSPRGARTQSDPAALQAGRPRDSTSGWILHQSAAVALSRLSCPGDPEWLVLPREPLGAAMLTSCPSLPPPPLSRKTLSAQNQGRGGSDASPCPARSIQT